MGLENSFFLRGGQAAGAIREGFSCGWLANVGVVRRLRALRMFACSGTSKRSSGHWNPRHRLVKFPNSSTCNFSGFVSVTIDWVCEWRPVKLIACGFCIGVKFTVTSPELRVGVSWLIQRRLSCQGRHAASTTSLSKPISSRPRRRSLGSGAVPVCLPPKSVGR